MKDLDFDELDRAVNSLIQNSPADTNTDEEKVIDITPTNSEQEIDESIVSQPIITKPASVEQVTTPSPIKSSPLAGRRSGGQFMDVVHPSSNMRKMPLAVPERTRPSVIPSAPVVPVTANLPPHDQSLDIQSNTEVDDIDKIADSINDELNSVNDSSLDSPFIPDAKVEKRPLGAFSDNQTAVIDAVDTTPEPEQKPTKQEHQPVDPGPKSDLPAELQDDLLHIEDDESTEIEESDKPVATIESDVKPMEITVANTEPVKNIETTSINQQYAEQPSTGDQNSGAIYDTDAYHKALVKPAKKKSGWLWVLWIAVLLALGAGAGAAIYILKVL